MKKIKYLCVLITIIAIAFLSSTCGGGTNVKLWDGQIEELISVGNSTYEIHTAGQLAALAKQTSFPAGNTYILKADIDLNSHDWKPIGNISSPFNGTFDGNGFLIKGLAIPENSFSGLFGCIEGTDKRKSIIKNIKLELTYNKINGYIVISVGALAGRAKHAKISNISVSGAEINLNIKSILKSNDFELYVGGIAGILDYADISNSSTIINITAKSSTIAVNVGGIVGNNNINSGTTTITACYSTGKITAITDSHNAAAAGISSISCGKINSCYSIGDISATSKSFNATAGGITALSCDTIVSSYSTSNVTVNAFNLGIAGGVTGMNLGTTTSSYASGNVTVTSLKGPITAGGIAGISQNTIAKCYATGNVNGKSPANAVSVGGIVGAVVKGTLENCVALNNKIIATGITNSSVATPVANAVESSVYNNIASIDISLSQNGTPPEQALRSMITGTSVKPSSLTQAVYTRTGIITVDSKGNIINGGLGWDSNTWDFPENKLPKLKWQSK